MRIGLAMMAMYSVMTFCDYKKALEGYVIPDFDQAMFSNERYQKAYEILLNNDAESVFLNQVRTGYNAFFNELPWQETPKIPKIIHQIWLGSPLPERYKAWQHTWIALHPDWEYKLWTDTDVEQLGLENKRYFDITKSYGEKANILRYELLYRFGGVYIDTDFECFKPLDFLHHTCDFYAGLEYPQTRQGFFIVGNAILAARPGHPLLRAFIDQMGECWNSKLQWKRSGTHYVTGIIKNMFIDLKGVTLLLPANIFYPWKGRKGRETKVAQPESIAYHHWDLSWRKKGRLCDLQ